VIYHCLVSSGDFVDTWVYFYMHPVLERMTLRDRYTSLACDRCGKFDEYEALRLGVDNDVVVRGRRDFVDTADGAICVSDRFKRVFESEGIRGIDFVPLKGGRYFVVRPTVIAPVDPATCGIKYIGEPCPLCGRYRESIYPPRIDSMTKPEDPMTVFSPSIRLESGMCRFAEVYITDQVASLLKPHNLRGIHWKASAKLL
jgi:hypothetical protein